MKKGWVFAVLFLFAFSFSSALLLSDYDENAKYTIYSSPTDAYSGATPIFKLGDDTISVGSADSANLGEVIVEEAGAFIWRAGYYRNYSANGGAGAWVPFTFNGPAVKTSSGQQTNWIDGRATKTLNIPHEALRAGANPVLAYSCKKYNDVWKCGCLANNETGNCKRWMLQLFNVTGNGPGDISNDNQGGLIVPTNNIRSLVCANQSNSDPLFGSCESNVPCRSGYEFISCIGGVTTCYKRVDVSCSINPSCPAGTIEVSNQSCSEIYVPQLTQLACQKNDTRIHSMTFSYSCPGKSQQTDAYCAQQFGNDYSFKDCYVHSQVYNSIVFGMRCVKTEEQQSSCSLSPTCPSGYTAISNTSCTLSQPQQSYIEVTQCMELNQSGKTYVLQRDITATGTCFNITANDITFDGDGYSLTGEGNGIGINLNGSNNEIIKNFVGINFFHTGISIYSSLNNNLSNIAVSNNGNGILIYSSSNNNFLSNITASDNAYGVYLLAASNNNLSNITSFSNDMIGIHLSAASNNNLFNIVASNNYYGILLYESSNNLLNGASSNSIYDISCSMSDTNTNGGLTFGNQIGCGPWIDTVVI